MGVAFKRRADYQGMYVALIGRIHPLPVLTVVYLWIPRRPFVWILSSAYVDSKSDPFAVTAAPMNISEDGRNASGIVRMLSWSPPAVTTAPAN